MRSRRYYYYYDECHRYIVRRTETEVVLKMRIGEKIETFYFRYYIMAQISLSGLWTDCSKLNLPNFVYVRGVARERAERLLRLSQEKKCFITET